MLRRHTPRAVATSFDATSVAWRSTSQTAVSTVDLVEREREKELRQLVLQKYRGMQIPEMTDIQYGHFSTGGIQAAAAQQAMSSQGYGSMFSSAGGGSTSTAAGGSCSTGNCGAGGSGGGAGASGATGGMPNGMPMKPRTDWLMLFTGLALMWVSAKIIYSQMTRGVDDLDFPLWTASLEVQAKHLLFCVQFDDQTRSQLKRDFQVVRQSNPFADFFQWVHSRQPQYLSGRVNSLDMAIGAVIQSLSNTNSRELMSFATALRQSLTRKGGDPQTRLDDFVNNLSPANSMLATMGGLSGRGGASSAPPASVPSYNPPSESYSTPMGMPHDVSSNAVNGSNPFEYFDANQKTA